MMSKASGDVRNYDGSGTWFKIDEARRFPNSHSRTLQMVD
jgi:hypothetical protein